MSGEILYLVTSDVRAALRQYCGAAPLPGWCRVVSDLRAIRAIPDGARCLGVWFSDRGRPSAVELEWQDHKARTAGFQARDFARFRAWRHGARKGAE